MSAQQPCRTRRTVMSAGREIRWRYFRSRKIPLRRPKISFECTKPHPIAARVFGEWKNKQTKIYVHSVVVSRRRPSLVVASWPGGRTFPTNTRLRFGLLRAVLRVTGYRSRSRLRPPAGMLSLFGGRKLAGTGPGGRRTAPNRARRRPPPGHGVFPRTRTTHRPPRNTHPPPTHQGWPPPPASYRFSAVTV